LPACPLARLPVCRRCPLLRATCHTRGAPQSLTSSHLSCPERRAARHLHRRARLPRLRGLRLRRHRQLYRRPEHVQDCAQVRQRERRGRYPGVLRVRRRAEAGPRRPALPRRDQHLPKIAVPRALRLPLPAGLRGRQLRAGARAAPGAAAGPLPLRLRTWLRRLGLRRRAGRAAAAAAATAGRLVRAGAGGRGAGRAQRAMPQRRRLPQPREQVPVRLRRGMVHARAGTSCLFSFDPPLTRHHRRCPNSFSCPALPCSLGRR